MTIENDLWRRCQTGNFQEVSKILEGLSPSLPFFASSSSSSSTSSHSLTHKRTWYQEELHKALVGLDIETPCGEALEDEEWKSVDHNGPRREILPSPPNHPPGHFSASLNAFQDILPSTVTEASGSNFEEIVREEVERIMDSVEAAYWEIERKAQAILNWGNLGDEKNTPLHIACLFGRTEIVELLCTDPRVDVNMRNEHGETALMLASGSSEPALIRALIGSKQSKRTGGFKSMEMKRTQLQTCLAERITRQAWERVGKPYRPLRMPLRPWRPPKGFFSFDVDLLATSKYGTTVLWSCCCFGREMGAKIVLANIPEGHEMEAVNQKKVTGFFQANTTPLAVARNESK